MAKKSSPFSIFFYGVVLFFFQLTRLLPLSLSRKFGIFLGDLAFFIIPRLKKIGMANLAIAYGDKMPLKEKKRILRGAARNLGIIAAEFSRIPSIAKGGLKNMISVEGIEEALSHKPAVLLAAHHSNWEWMLPVAYDLGLRTAVIVNPFRNAFLDHFVNQHRLSGGTITVRKQGAVQEMENLFKNGVSPSMLGDQSPRNGGVPIKFFGSPAWASIGPAMIAMKTDSPVIPASMARDNKGHYTLKFFPAIHMRNSGQYLEDLVFNTQRCQDALETIIRAHPEQWLWFHQRWRKRERLEKEWAFRLEKPSQDSDTVQSLKDQESA